MLKFVDKKGKLKYVLLDEEEEPRKADPKMKALLESVGINVDDEDIEEVKNLKPSGVLQDDLEYLKGD